MDKVRAQGSQLAQVAQDAAREGKVKLDQAQAKRRADALFRDLGAAVYAERTGRGSPDSKERIDRLVDALSRQEADQGLGDTDGKASSAEASSAEGSSAEASSAEGPSGNASSAEGPSGKGSSAEGPSGKGTSGESGTGGAGSNGGTGGAGSNGDTGSA
jgi:hypothetical protein